MASCRLRREDYSIGWVCALPIELAASRLMLDEEHHHLGQVPSDTNLYTLGRIGGHNIVVACLPAGQPGNSSAAAVATQMKTAFPSIRFGLMVGIGGGVPSEGADIRLGDVVVSQPYNGHGGVVQYDFGKATPSGFKQTGFLNMPPTILLNAVAKVQSNELIGRGSLLAHLSKLDDLPAFKRDNAGPDMLFEASYHHLGGTTCESCSIQRMVCRRSRRCQEILVHYGTIASGNEVMRDGDTRDRVSLEFGSVLCFEMEASGLMNSFPCLVIRGICDYADSHKNKKWEAYAAGTATAYAKEVLSVIPAVEVSTVPTQFSEHGHGPCRNVAPEMQLCQSNASPAQDIDKLQRELLSETERECLRALCLTDPHDDRQRLIDEKGAIVEGTCEWILGNNTYRSWLTAPNSKLLWLSGGPGKGKSMISIFLTEQLLNTVLQSNRAILAYYFCENKDHKRNTAVAILRGLILQLLKQRRDLFRCIIPDFQIREERLFTSDTALQALWRIFVDMLLRLKEHRVFCVLDGLDECEERFLSIFLQNVNQFFSKANDPSTGVWKLIVASRDNAECIRQELSAFDRLDLDSEGLQNELSSDVEKYVYFKSQELLNRKCYSDDLRNTVERALLNGADGMFLWVSLVCDEMKQKPRSEARETLQCLPRGLDAIYGRILVQAVDGYRDTLARVLRWVTVALRPLTLEELSAATGTADNTLRDIIESCRPLLRVDGGHVNFLHQSAKDYLLRETPDPDPRVELFRINKAEANLELARTCFRYIQSGPYEDGPCVIQGHSYTLPVDTERLQKFPLMAYATYYWPEHSQCSPAPVESLFDLSQPFFQRVSIICEAWWETYWDVKGDDLVPVDFTPLHIASFCGLVVLAQKLLKDSNRRLVRPNALHARDSHGKTPLHWAAYNGHKEVTKLLLEKGADLEAKDTERAKMSALHFAADNGHESVVELLLDFGADVDSEDQNGWTALHHAVLSGHELVARLLIEKGSDCNAREGDGRTALHFAVEYGHEAIARLLLDSGADLDAEDETGGVPFHEAAANGNTAIVRLLLDRGADIEARTTDGKSALYFAAHWGYEATVRLLLEKGANPNYEADHGEAVLLSAVKNGHEVVVRLLLEIDGVNPDYYGNKALLSAARNGCESVVRLLLGQGIFQGSKDWLAIAQIYNAARSGQEILVRQLLENNSVDPNLKDSNGRTLLSIAASTNCSTVVKLLLQRGCIDLDSQDESGYTPLWHAVNRNCESVVRLLLEAGADPEIKDFRKTSPLSLANQNREHLVPILKEYARTRRKRAKRKFEH